MHNIACISAKDRKRMQWNVNRFFSLCFFTHKTPGCAIFVQLAEEKKNLTDIKNKCHRLSLSEYNQQFQCLEHLRK